MARPHKRHLRRLVLAAIVASLAVAAVVPANARIVARISDETSLAPTVLARGVKADGTVVRRDGDLTVERLSVGDRIAGLAGDRTLYRVTLLGDYAPRALRYVILADGVPVALGIPRRNEGALIGVTTDTAVLSADLTAGYGDGTNGPAIAPTDGAPPLGAPLDRVLPGPFDVTRTDYDLGDQVFQPKGLPGRVELVGDVHYPTDLSAGPYPLVLFLHGNHSSCYKGNRAGYDWPCPTGWKPIPNHEGYAYIAKRLASYGFIVASVSGNGVNVLGNFVFDTGMEQRGLLLEKHFDLWNDWNTIGGDPFGTTFVGAVDMSRTGVMGHSRGGEGAVWNVIVDRERAVPYGIDAVLPLAPVDFTRVTINEVPLGVILPDCDGDVSDLQGVHFFDDSRYVVPGDTSPKAHVLAFGANHNFFNTVWSPSSGIPGAFDDAFNCPDQLTEREQRRVGQAYIVSFFRRYVGAAAERGQVWTGELTPNIGDARTLVTYLAPDTPATRLDLVRFTEPSDLGSNELGGDVIPSALGFVGWCSNEIESPCSGDFMFNDIHLSYSWFSDEFPPGLQEAIFSWPTSADGNGKVRMELPGGADVTPYGYLAFRTVPNPSFLSNDGIQYQDMEVVLEDGTGATVAVAAADIGNDALRFPLHGGRRRASGHIVMNQIRFPLAEFAGVDLTDIVAVELAFSRTDRGAINVSDVAFMAGE